MKQPRGAGRLFLASIMLGAMTDCQAAPRMFSAQDAQSPLKLERRIALPGVAGRIDHLAIDPVRHLLFVAEYGNGTVDIIDLPAGRVAGRITGLHEPQGLGVSTDGQQLVVACGDGTVHFYATADRRAMASLSLGDDADDVRIDPRNGHVIVGYGSGGLAVIDPASHRVTARLALPGHPEGFALWGSKVFVNIPGRGAIVSGDLDRGVIMASWSTGLHRLNFPMAIDAGGQQLAVAYRFASALQLRQIADGQVRATVGACGDADDLYFDGDRLYLVCGSGYVDVVAAPHPETGAQRVVTAAGARTGLFVPATETLYVAAPARGGEAAIWVLQSNRTATVKR
jgi:hypothetical protein